jgi:HAD superfamily hydrolase (TIGR01490 family)
VEAAFFDLDKTVIAKPSMVAFGRPLYDAGMISAGSSCAPYVEQRAVPLPRRRRGAHAQVQDPALRITRMGPGAHQRDRPRHAHRCHRPDRLRRGRSTSSASTAGRLFIISASPEEIVAPLAQYLGVDEAIASRAALDDEGRYTGDVEFWSYGPYKAEAILDAAERHGIDLDASYAYSDSATDVPMLELVGHPVAVNPDRDLARVARERDWEVRIFAQGVPLRERVNMPPPGKTVAVLGLVTVVGAASATAWWWWRGRVPPTPPSRLAGARAMGTRAAATRLGRRPGPAAPARRNGNKAGRAHEGPSQLGLMEWVLRRPAASSRRTRPERAGR